MKKKQRDLFDAVTRMDVAGVDAAIKKGANPNYSEVMSGVTPLMLAARCNDVPMIDLLIDNGADVDMVDKLWRNALSHAFKYKAMAAFERLTFEDLDCEVVEP